MEKQIITIIIAIFLCMSVATAGVLDSIKTDPTKTINLNADETKIMKDNGFDSFDVTDTEKGDSIIRCLKNDKIKFCVIAKSKDKNGNDLPEKDITDNLDKQELDKLTNVSDTLISNNDKVGIPDNIVGTGKVDLK